MASLPEQADFTRKTFVVLGAHRSGTSFLMNCLNRQGVYIGTGGWRAENGRFVRLNRDIIQSAGGTWLEPPPAQDILEASRTYVSDIEDLLSWFGEDEDLRGWKDPRQPLTMPAYLPYLDGDAYIVAIFRKPERSAASLVRMGQVASIEHGETLAREYARRTIQSIELFMNITHGEKHV